MYFRNQKSVTPSAVFPRIFSLNKPVNKPNTGSAAQIIKLLKEMNENQRRSLGGYIYEEISIIL